MAWIRERIDNQLYAFFSFYSSNGVAGVAGSVAETITGGDAGETEHFKITEVRVHCSVVVASVEDLIIHLTAKQGSAYDLTLVSQAMNGVQDFLWQPENPIQFVSGDTVSVWMSLDSSSNQFGINIQGWAVSS